MGLSLFHVKKGLNIDGLSQVLAGSGAPGGSGDSASAPKGSQYLDYTNGQLYVKKATGTGTDKWIRLQDKSDMDAALQGISWREPVLVHSSTSYANKAAAETEVNTGTIDGVAVVAGDRILFDNITGANKNVFTVTGTPGSSATLTEDANTVSKGDALYVQSGSDAGKQFSYNGTVWVQQGAASSTEIGFVKSFIGKSADGNETPDYSSNYVVTDGGSLEDAIGELDTKVGSYNLGPFDPTFVELGNDTIMTSLIRLDVNLALARRHSFGATVGSDTATPACSTNLSGLVLDECFSVEWRVAVRDGNNRWFGVVTAIFNLATDEIDYNISSILKIGTDIAGLDVYPTLFDNMLQLLVKTTSVANYSVTRTLNGSFDAHA